MLDFLTFGSIRLYLEKGGYSGIIVTKRHSEKNVHNDISVEAKLQLIGYYSCIFYKVWTVVTSQRLDPTSFQYDDLRKHGVNGPLNTLECSKLI